MEHANERPRELPTRRRSLTADDNSYGRFRRLALASGLTSNLALHALLDCFDAHGRPARAPEHAGGHSPRLPAKERSPLLDDATHGRFRRLAASSGLTGNLMLSALLDCFDVHGGPIRVEGAGLRIPCGIDAPCAPDGPSAGPVQAIHVNPTRRRADGPSAGELRRRIAAANAVEAKAREQGARLRAAILEAAASLGPD